jgi:predicted esterase
LLALIDENKNDYEHIFVGGFSMGGCLCLHLLRHRLPPNVRGIFTMGSFLVGGSVVVNKAQLFKDTPHMSVLMMHGSADALIRVEWGRATATNLILREVDVAFKEFQYVDHDISEEMLADLLHWIQDRILVGCQSKLECLFAHFWSSVSV